MHCVCSSALHLVNTISAQLSAVTTQHATATPFPLPADEAILRGRFRNSTAPGSSPNMLSILLTAQEIAGGLGRYNWGCPAGASQPQPCMPSAGKSPTACGRS